MGEEQDKNKFKISFKTKLQMIIKKKNPQKGFQSNNNCQVMLYRSVILKMQLNHQNNMLSLRNKNKAKIIRLLNSKAHY